PYAIVPVNGHQETWPLESKEFRYWLNRRYYELQRGMANPQRIEDVVDQLSARALFEGPREKVHVRVAAAAGSIYLDLGTDVREVAEIKPGEGWQVLQQSPVRFRRAPAS